ncbi:MAG: RHS repeat domain-containing protein [Bacteroidota bacterium]
MKRLFTLCLLVPNLFFCFLFTEQVGTYSLFAQDLELYPKLQSYITPSPQAASITRYGDYPVNYNTGLVDMKIPLYNIKSGNLSLPMDISFHASGRMANETNGVLGMRWVLNAGGVVTRTVHGYPDEWDYLTSYTVNPNHTPDYDELRRTCTENFLAMENGGPNYNKTDSELDVFRYVLPSGKRGQFVLKTENGVKKAVQIPYEALKIELIQDNSYYGYYGGINITDVDGTIYYYGNGSTVYNSKYCEFNQDNYSLPGSIPTGWYIKKIVSADSKDIIEFDYQNMSVTKIEARESITTCDRIRNYSVHDVYDSCDTYGPYLINEYLFELPREHQNGSISPMTVPALKSIIFKDGELNFSYTGQSIINKTALQYITLTGADNKKFKFNQELNATETELRYLNSLEILSISNGLEKVEEKYSFDYYKLASGNIPLSNGSAYLKDWWGYYDGNADNLLPQRSVDFYRNDGSNFHYVFRDIGGNANRDPDLESMKLGMIKSITYPTGGNTVFEYENNYYKEQTLKYGPGLRIKKVTNKPIIGAEMIKNYKYGNNEDKTGDINPALKPGQHTVQESSMMVYYDFINCLHMPHQEQVGYRIRNFSSEPLISPGDFGGNTIWYDMVTEYSEEDSSYSGEYYNEGKNGKIIYVYSPKYFDTKQFVIIDNEYYIDYPKVFADPYNLWLGGKLLSKNVYKKENGVFIPALKESYNYYDLNFEEVWDMPTYRHVNFSVDRSEHANNNMSFQYNAEKYYHNNICSVYGYGYRKYVSGSEKLANKTIEHFDGAGITAVTHYFYDPQYDQLRKEETTNSDGNQIRLEYEYPFDKTSLSLPNVYNKMVNMNILSPAVSKSQYTINGTNSVFLQSKRTDYSEPYPNIIRPSKEYYKKGSNTEEAIILYNNYDNKGNPAELQMANGTTIAYIWGYNQTQPVAKIENATQAQITALSLNMTLINNSATTDTAMQTELQKIRAGLPNAMVSTYTYKPLIGISTMTDPKGNTITYNYDSFGRLQNVKDKDGNILSENEYHYKN